MTTDTQPIEDKILSCVDCGNRFMWTAGEQKFFYDKGLQNVPKRCKPCAALYKAKLTEKHPRWWIKCSNCKRKAEVPFEPKADASVLCEECFSIKKAERDAKLAKLGQTFPVETNNSENV